MDDIDNSSITQSLDSSKSSMLGTDDEIDFDEDSGDDESDVSDDETNAEDGEDEIEVEGVQFPGEDVHFGRPEKPIDMDLVAFMRDNFMKWNYIAAELNVSRDTLRRRCRKSNYVDNKPFASHDKLRDLVSDFHSLLPNQGNKISML